jgi:hypothetical protein
VGSAIIGVIYKIATHRNPGMVRILLFGAVYADDVAVCYTLSLFGWILAFALEENSFGCGDKATDFYSKQLHPHVLVLWMLHKVAVFKELAGFIVEDGKGHVVEEFESRVLS